MINMKKIVIYLEDEKKYKKFKKKKKSNNGFSNIGSKMLGW